MYDFDKLEKKCKKYYIKRYLPIGFVLIALASAGVYGFYAVKNGPLPKKQNIKIKQKKVVKQKPKEEIITKPQIKHKPAQPKQNREVVNLKAEKNSQCYYLQFFVVQRHNRKYIETKQNKLSKLGFHCYVFPGKKLLYLRCNKTKDYNEFLNAKKLADKYKLHYITKKVMCNGTKATKPAKKIQEKKKVINQTTAQELTKKHQPEETKFTLQSQKVDIATLTELYQERKNYNLSLKIAQKYYEKQNYDQAIKWAKEANSINKVDDASWIIYAKSLYAKKEYKKAKKILQIYTKFENSSQVDKLLSEWSEK